jgi:hypothetical protein
MKQQCENWIEIAVSPEDFRASHVVVRGWKYHVKRLRGVVA